MEQPTLIVREAQPGDVPAIFELIGELADFERLRHEMTGTKADLARHLFGAERYAQALMAFWGGQAAAFALYFHNYSTFLCRPGIYLEDLFVRPAFRGHGIGRALLLDLEARAIARGCGRLEWSVLEWNETAIDFYRKFGAAPNNGWIVYRKSLPVGRATNAQHEPGHGVSPA